MVKKEEEKKKGRKNVGSLLRNALAGAAHWPFGWIFPRWLERNPCVIRRGAITDGESTAVATL